MGQDINQAGKNHLPGDYLAFLCNTAFPQGLANAMRQRVLLSWLGNANNADPVNALNNLIQAEHDDASTQVLGDIEANFGEPPAGAQNNNNQHQAANNVNTLQLGFAAPGEIKYHDQEQVPRFGAAQQQIKHQGGKSVFPFWS